MRVEPYLYFQGRCEEAMAFYRQALGAEAFIAARFSDIPGANPSPGGESKVAHAVIRFGESTVLASDGGGGTAGSAGISLSLTAADDAEAERLFAALAEQGDVRMPLSPSPFASRFGMVADRFGVPWIVVVQTAPGGAR
jgi:PhnB protein